MSEYNQAFYQYQMQGSLRSARAVVPLVLELTGARSVLDVGCGVGTWLSVYREQGIDDVLGLDGDYVDRKLLMIGAEHFRAHDLGTPLELERKFDLVQSLEVAEHLQPAYAAQFIAELTRLGDIILFSAAVPCQLGTGHVNEQFIDYWIKHFAAQGYQPVDYLRPRLWDNETIEVCYRQNMLIFANEAALTGNPQLQQACRDTNKHQLSVIHPDLYQPRLQRLLTTLLDFGRTVQANGNFPLAHKTFRSIVDFDPANSTAWDALGQLEAGQGKLNTAIGYLQRAISLDPQQSGFHYNLGLVYAASGNTEAARESYHRALQLRPDNTAARTALDKLP